MKVLVSFVVVFMLLSPGLNAQSKFIKQLTMGMGIGCSSIWGGSYGDPTGVQAGLALHLKQLGKNLSLRAGLNGTLQGAEYHDPGIDGVVRLAYLNVPVTIKCQRPGGIFGEAGLQPGFIVSAKDKYGGNTYDFKNGVNSFELGLPVEAGYIFKNGIGASGKAILGITGMDSDGNHNFLALFCLFYNFSGRR